MPTLLEDDVLNTLLYLPGMMHNSFNRAGLFFFGFLVVTAVCDFLVIVFTNQWHLFFTQYSALGGGLLIVFSSYITVYTTYKKKYDAICNFILPGLWSLRSLGEKKFHEYQKIGKMMKHIKIALIAAVMLTATIALPWFGTEYYTYFPVKVAVDYFNKWELHLYLVVFYIAFYHFGLTLLASVCSLMYFVVHLYLQYDMLNKMLEKFGNYSINAESTNEEYQNFITREIKSCIRLHQKLLEFTDAINDLIYYPIFYFTASGVVTALSVIILVKSDYDPFRPVSAAAVAVCVAVAFCYLGQMLENKSAETFISASSTPWYLWSTKNRKLLLLLLVRTQENVVLSSSGLITINFQLLIRLSRAIYSALTFFINVSTIEKNS